MPPPADWPGISRPILGQDGPVHQLRTRPARRLVQLYAGLALYGLSMALLVRSGLGVMPWDVLHQGLARQLGWALGVGTIVVGALVLLAWAPLLERPVLGQGSKYGSGSGRERGQIV